MKSSVAPPSDLSGWVLQVELEARGTQNITLGIANGHRHPTDRRVLDHLARGLTSAATPTILYGKLLIVRLRDDLAEYALGRAGQGDTTLVASPSPLGGWDVIDLAVSRIAKQRAEVTQFIARALPTWKQQYKLILVDLGSLGDSISRQLGFLCDGSYVILGPESCGAPEWLRLQIGRHSQAGSQVCGTITVAASRVA